MMTRRSLLELVALGAEFHSVTDAEATQMIKMFGRNETKLGTLYFDLIHNSEMYGQIVAYPR